MQNHSCRNCNTQYSVTKEDLEFYDKISPVLNNLKHQVPPPKLCPRCRQQRRLGWRNDMNLFRRSCDLCNKSMVSIHPQEAIFPVYCVSCWWSDKWSALDYGIEYDRQRPFLPQYLELQKTAPQIAIINDNGVGSENSEYCYDISRAKNCYRVVGSWYIEECMYSLNVNRSKYVVDCNTVGIESELVYESLDSQRLYLCAYLQYSEGCHECYFGYDLKGCSYCLGCYGLRHKKFHIFNKPYSEEEYKIKLAEINLGSYQGVESFKTIFENWAIDKPRRAANIQNSDDCVGNNIFNSKSVLGYSVLNSEYCKYVDRSDGPRNSYDIINTGGCQWCCDCVTPDDSYLVLFSDWCWKSKNILYSDNCHSSGNLFGCISMRRNEYCILNKQYTEESYNEVVSEIIKSLRAEDIWGEHLDIAYSHFPYNISAASEYYPLSKSEVIAKNWKWAIDMPYTTGKQTIEQDDLPDDIKDVTDEICNEVLACSCCSRNYKITAQELSFYRKIPAPLPRNCHNCRHLRRFKKKTLTQLWDRTCNKCSRQLKTVYPESGREIIYCDDCYFAEIY